MNWGKGIAIALAAFISFIIVLVVILVSQPVDLETEDYYKKDIAYQTEISSMENANALIDKPVITMTNTHIIVQLSADRKLDNIELRLNRPNDETLDKLYKINGTHTFTLDKNELVKGIYKLELSYKINDVNYMQKEKYYI